MLSKRIKLIFNLSIVMVLSILLMACNPEGPQSTFDAQGPVSEIQKNLFLFTFWIAVIVFIVVEGAILFVTFRYRRKNDELPVQTHGNQKLEIMYKVLYNAQRNDKSYGDIEYVNLTFNKKLLCLQMATSSCEYKSSWN